MATAFDLMMEEDSAQRQLEVAHRLLERALERVVECERAVEVAKEQIERIRSKRVSQ